MYTHKILLIVFIALQAMLVKSQNIRYGVIVGADITTMQMSDVPSFNNKSIYSPLISYNLNGFVSYKGDSFIGLSVEPGIIRKGGIQLFDYLDSQYRPINKQVIASITSIQLPVLVDLHINDKFYISIGVEIENRISQKAKMTDTPTTQHIFAGSYPLYVARGTGLNSIGDDIVPDDNYPSIYYSGLVGMQYMINNRFDIGLRYGTSLKQLYSLTWRDEFNSVMGVSKLYTSYLQLSLKVRL